MENEKLWALIRKLKARTLEDRVAWEGTTRENAYQAAFPGYSIVISNVADEEWGRDDYFLSIYDTEGRLVEKVSDAQLDAGMAKKEAHGLLGEVFDAARRQALGVDEALDAVMLALDQDVAM